METLLSRTRWTNFNGWLAIAVSSALLLLLTAAVCTAQNPGPPETPAIYVVVGNRPSGIPIEIPLGATRTFTLANATMWHVGSTEPFQLQHPPSSVRWSIEP